MFTDAVFSTEEILLVPGDRIIMHTDGIVEAWNPQHEIYGDERFHSLIRDNIKMNANDFTALVAETVRTWTLVNSERGLLDDVTLIVIDFMV
jgi:sigma-B regulation protein RsbU (phosphoserine phosphatase)